MSGGLLQLVAYGAQDIYITGNPTMTYFKTVYRRHTNFSIETIEHPFDQVVDFGNKSSITVPRNGDLITRMYFKATIGKVELSKGSKFAWVDFIGLAMLDFIELEIGGSRIDKLYGIWIIIWFSLVRDNKLDEGYRKIIGAVGDLVIYNETSKPEYTIYVPLDFWYYAYYSYFIPLISLQYHEVVVHINISRAKDIIVANKIFLEKDFKKLNIKKASLLVEYIYLDSEERRKLAQTAQEYLINQLQFTGIDNAVQKVNSYRLDFNHPTKGLYWFMRNGDYIKGKPFVFYTVLGWTLLLDVAAKKILRESILLTDNPELFNNFDIFLPETTGKTSNGNILVINNSKTKSIIVNIDSLKIGNYGITNKIEATIFVTIDNSIDITNITPGITVRDLSFPVTRMIDTRFTQDDPYVNQFTNFGILINSAENPVEFANIQFNGIDRFSRRRGKQRLAVTI